MKKLKLSFYEWIVIFFGFGYFVNFGTKEIHRLKHKTKRCRLEMITKGELITYWQARRLLTNGYNGCKYCYPEKNTG